MSKKTLINLSIVLVVLVVLALIQHWGKTSRRPVKADIGETLLEGVDINTIAQISITQGSNTVELAKQEGKWVVKSLFNYPADFGKLAEELRKLAEVKSGKPVRSGNVALSEFGLDDKTRKKVVFSSESGETLASIEIGARREGSRQAGWSNQHFVRLGGKDVILLVDHDFYAFSDDSTDWIDDELLNVPSDDVISVKVSGMELKADGSEWKLADLDEETEEMESYEADKLRRALSYLNCSSIADPAKSDAELGFDKAVTYVAHTKDGFTYHVTLGGKADDGRYVRLAVEYTKPEPPAKPEEEDKDKQDEYKKKLEEYKKEVADNRKKADELNQKFSGWTYIISNYDADDMLLTRDKLVKKKEKPEEEKSEEDKSKKEENSKKDETAAKENSKTDSDSADSKK